MAGPTTPTPERKAELRSRYGRFLTEDVTNPKTGTPKIKTFGDLPVSANGKVNQDEVAGADFSKGLSPYSQGLSPEDRAQVSLPVAFESARPDNKFFKYPTMEAPAAAPKATAPVGSYNPDRSPYNGSDPMGLYTQAVGADFGTSSGTPKATATTPSSISNYPNVSKEVSNSEFQPPIPKAIPVAEQPDFNRAATLFAAAHGSTFDPKSAMDRKKMATITSLMGQPESQNLTPNQFAMKVYRSTK